MRLQICLLHWLESFLKHILWNPNYLIIGLRVFPTFHIHYVLLRHLPLHCITFNKCVSSELLCISHIIVSVFIYSKPKSVKKWQKFSKSAGNSCVVFVYPSIYLCIYVSMDLKIFCTFLPTPLKSLEMKREKFKGVQDFGHLGVA